ncbi:MAG: ribulose-phosphate 3-epimerase [Planctomycetales bacterium]|nr:ribulose-phosphate 3-epimerase [Planctomycetales bacterium]MCA9167001.1 ribulose-phosphate 3-epimerase [Planctomycetales bacterium]
MNRLRTVAPVILPSLLMCDFGNLEREVRRLEDDGVHALHLDVMDGHFVPNLTYGMPIVEALRKLTTLPLDVHLMISEPQRYVPAFVDAGSDVVTIHVEATPNPGEVLDQIHALGAATGLALNPDTPVTAVTPYLSQSDMVLVMSVNAGFGGQSFNPVALEKLSYLRSVAPESVLLEVDGGVNTATIAQCAAAGAQLFVVGSAIFRQPDYGAAVKQLCELAGGGIRR